MQEKIIHIIKEALVNLEIADVDFVVEHPEDLKNGDYSTNVAMAGAKNLKMNPKELAEKIKSELEKNLPQKIEKIEVAGAGYVKNINLIFEKLGELMADPEKNAFIIGELHRRIGFEFNGMRNHEYYFKSLEGGTKPLPADSQLKKELEKVAGSVENAMMGFKTLAMTRGVGWAILYYDKQSKQLIPAWIDEQHMGQLQGLQYVLGIDMWEHSYVYDYPTSEKKKYVEAFFANLNWEVIEENFKKAQ